MAAKRTAKRSAKRPSSSPSSPTRSTIYVGAASAGVRGPRIGIEAATLDEAVTEARSFMDAHQPHEGGRAYVFSRTVNHRGERVGDDGANVFEADALGGRWSVKHEEGERAAAEKELRRARAALDEAIANDAWSQRLQSEYHRAQDEVDRLSGRVDDLAKARARLWADVDAGRVDRDWAARHYGPRPNPSPTEDFSVVIEFGAVPNVRGPNYGWLPMIWEHHGAHGWARGDTYAPQGFDRDQAIAIAKARAVEHAAKFVGDWKVTIKPRGK